MSLGQAFRTGLIFTAQLLRFYSRLPAPKLPFEEDPYAMPDFAKAAPYLPIAGLIIGAIGALALLAGSHLNLGTPLAAILAIAALVIVTGSFHEDGLADVADGFWGGSTPDRRLEIMKDSRIGTYGGAALVLSLLLRTVAIAEIAERAGVGAAALAVLIIAPFSRVCALMPLTLLPPARSFGASRDAGKPSLPSFAIALAGSALIVLLAGLFMQQTGALLAGMALAILASFGMVGLSRAKINGQTGDVAGATQQITEIVFLLTLVSAS